MSKLGMCKQLSLLFGRELIDDVAYNLSDLRVFQRLRGAGIRQLRPQEVTKTTPSVDRTT